MEPNEIMVVQQILADVEEAEEEAANPPRELHLQQQINPLERLSDAKFRKYFRLSKELTRHVIELVTPFMVGPSRRSALSVEHKVLIALKLFGFGSYQEMTGTNKYLSVSQASVSRSVKEVAEALNQPEILNNIVRFPNNLEDLENLRQRFFHTYRFPGIVGCIDCTHVAIVAPPGNDPLHPENIYINRKQYHSLNVQLICDENLRILNVNARFPGSTHDAYIWRQSAMSGAMQHIYRQHPENSLFLIGDSGYPLRPYLLTPLRNPGNAAEEAFNTRLQSIRSLIERCNAMLKNRFRCLLRHRVLHYRPVIAAKIINACVVLHNLCIDNNIPEPEYDNEVEEVDWGMYPDGGLNMDNLNINPQAQPELEAARQLIQHIINVHFR